MGSDKKGPKLQLVKIDASGDAREVTPAEYAERDAAATTAHHAAYGKLVEGEVARRAPVPLLAANLLADRDWRAAALNTRALARMARTLDELAVDALLLLHEAGLPDCVGCSEEGLYCPEHGEATQRKREEVERLAKSYDRVLATVRELAECNANLVKGVSR